MISSYPPLKFVYNHFENVRKDADHKTVPAKTFEIALVMSAVLDVAAINVRRDCEQPKQRKPSAPT